MSASLLLHEQFARHVAETPAAPALQEGATLLSYARLDREVDNAAHVLRDRGIGRGTTVAIEWPVSARYVTAMLAIMRLGAAFLPLDPAWPAERRLGLARAAGAALLLTDQPDGREPALTAAALAAAGQAYCAAGVPPAADAGAAGQRMYLMSTSGSAGEPRLVDVSHAAVAGLFSGIGDGFYAQPGAVWSSLHSAAFGYSQWEIWGALANGGCLVIIPEAWRRDPQAWAREIRERGVTALSLTPSGLRQWRAAGWPSPGAQLRSVFVSGEALAPADVAAWFAAPLVSRPRLLSCYGLTETAGRVAVHEVAPGDALRNRAVIGAPAADADIRLLDPQTLRPVTGGERGELFVTGPMLADGYLGDSVTTAQRFIELAEDDGTRRYLRTGDLAVRAADGALEFAGRADGQLKLRGQRIEAAEIEHALQAHPLVAQAGVALVEGPAGQRLQAWVVPAQSPGGVEFWPSLGEYQVYDDLLYDFMSADETRVDAYRRALQEAAPGRIVLDVGTGKDAVLARIAAQAGAAHVYAVEVLPDAAAKARALVERLGLDGRITVIEGDMEHVDIPEPVDVCTQGIVGNIGSSDGIAPIWNAARRSFAPDCIALPGECTTFVAPARLPDALRRHAAFGPLAAEYTRRVFAAEGAEFDVRLCVRNFPEEALLAPPALFERLDFAGCLPLEHAGECVFSMAEGGWVDGYVLWTRLQLGAHCVDFFAHQQAWLPVWMPLGDESLEVAAGSELRLRWRCETPAGQVFPDYHLRTDVISGATRLSSEYCSRHFATARGETALHRSLLASLQAKAAALADSADAGMPLPEALRDWVGERLPRGMVPDAVHVVAGLPLTASHKLDRDALAAMGAVSAGSARAPGHDDEAADLSPLERAVAGVWRDVLGVADISSGSDFFAAGGDSISAVRCTTEIQRLLDATVFLAGIYEAPVLRDYCNWLTAEHPQAVAARPGMTADSAVATAAPASRTLPAGPVPLNAAQRNLWFLQQLYPGNTAANEQFVIRMRGVAAEQVIAAWEQLAQTHAALRLKIVPGVREDELPQQVAVPFVAELHGVQEVIEPGAADKPEAELQRLAQREIRRPFSLEHGALYRALLVQLPRDELALLVTAHHIAADGLCIELIRDRLFAACRDGSLESPAIDFPGVLRNEQAADADIQWWRERLAGVTVEPVSTPLSAPQAAGPEARLSFELPAALADALRRLARAQGASLFTVLLAGWRLWLARCFDREDFLIGSPVTLRNTRETAGVIGCMVNNLAFRNPLDLQQGFVTLLAAERDGLRAALDHAAVGFDRIVDVVQPRRVFGRHPLFQFMFQFAERSAPRVGPGMEFDADVLAADRSSYWDIELAITDRGTGTALRAVLGVRTDLFEAAALAGWGEGMVALFDAVTATPDLPLARLPLLSPAQRQRALDVAGESIGAPGETLFGAFVAQALRTPERVALTDDAGDVTYRSLAADASHWRQMLVANAVGKGDTVAVCVPAGRQFTSLLLAVNAVGAAWLVLDPEYPLARLQAMLIDSGAGLLLRVDTAPALVHPRVLTLAERADCGIGHTHSEADDKAAAASSAAGDSLSVQFTSGSTGRPKGIVLSQQAALLRLRWYWARGDRNGAGRFAQRTSLGFVDAIWEIFGPLLHGGHVVFAPPAARRDMRALAAWVQRQAIEHLVIFPSALPALLGAWEEGGVAPPLRHVIVTGEPMAAPLVRRFAALLPGCVLVNTYGLSETWDIATARLDTRPDSELIPAGTPVPGVRAAVRDARGELLPAGVPGDLWVSFPGLATAYLNDPPLSAERFCIRDGANEFNTGDLARRGPADELLLHGRRDRQIKLRGLRVEPGEVEALAAAVPGVRECAAVLHGDDPERAWLALYAVADPTLIDSLRATLRAQLPAALVPAEIISVDMLPRTPSGKLDTRQLQQWRPQRDDSGTPLSDTERRLAIIWQGVLGCGQVSRDDDFFALRGNSLLATRLIARICDEFGLDLPLAAVFEEPTLAGLAAAVDALLWAATAETSRGDGREVLRL